MLVSQLNICRGSSVVERSPEEAGVDSSILSRGTLRQAQGKTCSIEGIGGYRIVAITPGCQSGDTGSTPVTRSKQRIGVVFL